MADQLPEKLQRVLIGVLELDREGKTPASANEIGYQCGYRPAMARSGNHGRGNVARTMGEAVHVTGAITSLRRRGLLHLSRRRDDMSGSADMLTRDGTKAAHAAIDAGLDSNAARAEGKTTRAF